MISIPFLVIAVKYSFVQHKAKYDYNCYDCSCDSDGYLTRGTWDNPTRVCLGQSDLGGTKGNPTIVRLGQSDKIYTKTYT